MKSANRSTVTEFILLGLTNDQLLQVFLFPVLLSVYTFTLLGNIVILLIVSCNVQLQTPMYFFLTQLSLLDITFSSVISPRMLTDLLFEEKTISFHGCISQIYFYGACVGTEFFLLAVMAFDRYVAICNPLLYTLTVTKCRCVSLAAGSFIGGFLHSLIHTVFLQWLSFCGPDVIDHFACDYSVLLKLSCTDPWLNDLVRFVLAAFVVAASLLVIIFSYYNIVTAILRIHTTTGRHQAASTCISHFTSVLLFCGSSFFLEILPNSSSSKQMYKVLSLILTVVIPALNPLIYSLRNKAMKHALRKILYLPVHSFR